VDRGFEENLVDPGSALVGQFGTDLYVDCNEKDEKPLEMK